MAISLATKAATDALSANRAPINVGAQEVHKWMQTFNWDFKENSTKYPTKYKMANDTKEQFKLIAKEYARMESVKDERQFGTLLDGIARLDGGNRVHPRWGEAMKVVSNFLEVGEYNAIAATAMLWDSATASEQKNGYLAQTMDEIRHTHQCGFVNYYFSKHYHDPAGHNDARRTRSIGPLWKGMKRVFADGFISGDAVECSVSLQLVGEACFTNPLIVAVTEWASANGDEVTPTVFLSIETDELRHMANGYQTIVSIANDPAAQKYLNTDLNNAFWTQQKFFTPALGFLFEYGSKFKVEPWVKTWNRWVYEDWGGIWIGRLGKYGIKSPASLRDAKQDAYWAHHDLALIAYATWPLGFFRLSLPDAEDMAWFEANYPGWHAHYGVIYEEWKRLGCEDPKSGFLPMQWLAERGHTVYIDRVSQVPFCPSLAKGAGSLRVHELNGKKHSFTDNWGERMFLSEPERYECQNILEQYEGREISEVVLEGMGVRADGKTLISQPHVNGENLWTIDDLKRANCVFVDPVADFKG
jgi:methane monooxygenase component A alpha chain